MHNEKPPKIPNPYLRVLGQLEYLFCRYRDKKKEKFDGSFFQSDAQLQNVLKIKGMTIRRARKRLVALGEIECTQGNGRGLATTYRIPKLYNVNTTQNETRKTTTLQPLPEQIRDYAKLVGKDKATKHYTAEGVSKSDILDALKKLK